MGRQWLYKTTGGVDGGGGGTKPMNRKQAKDKNASGCMSVIFNLIDIQHHQFRFHHPSMPPESAMDVAPTSSKAQEQTNLHVPVGKIQIKTKRSRFSDDLSECSSSPGTKTPNLVARLMGLDLLPEYSSPRPSSSSTPATGNHHTRSLPATPRMSTVSRRSTDNDHHHHRLSLQINKENYHCNNNQMKAQYAKQVTKQVRERISQRLGTDITNTVSPAVCKDRRRDSDLVLLKPKKTVAVILKPDNSTQLSSSPKLRLLDNIKSNINKQISNSHSSSIKEVKPKFQTTKVHKQPVKDEKIKRIASERYDSRLKKKMHEQKKSTTLRNHLLNRKNQMTSSCSTARSSQLKVSLPSNLNSSYKGDVTTHNLYIPIIIGSDLTVKLRHRTGSFPADIDGLIEGYMGRSTRRLLAAAYATEAEDIVKEIEGEIVKNLLHEIATEPVAPAGGVV